MKTIQCIHPPHHHNGHCQKEDAKNSTFCALNFFVVLADKSLLIIIQSPVFGSEYLILVLNGIHSYHKNY